MQGMGPGMKFLKILLFLLVLMLPRYSNAEYTAKDCIGCHPLDLKKAYVHPPVQEGDCLLCHSPEYGETGGHSMPSTEKIANLCLQCHETVLGTHLHGRDPGRTYVDAGTGKKITCVSCHDPHASDHDKMTVLDRRQKLCQRCHIKRMSEL